MQISLQFKPSGVTCRANRPLSHIAATAPHNAMMNTRLTHSSMARKQQRALVISRAGSVSVLSLKPNVFNGTNLNLPTFNTPITQIVEVDEQQLEMEVANRDRPLIIDFYATWYVDFHNVTL